MEDKAELTPTSENKTNSPQKLFIRHLPWKENWEKLILITVIVLIVSIGVYVLLTKLGSNLHTSDYTAPSQSETASWKTHRNNELHYEFRYPSDGLEPQATPVDSDFVISYRLRGGTVGENTDLYSIKLEYLKESQLEFNGPAYCKSNLHDTDKCEKRMVGGSETIIDWKIPIDFPPNASSKLRALVGITHPEGGMVTLELEPVSPESKETFEQILTTFKFLETETIINSSNWKTYKYNSLTFKYPPEWRADNFYVASMTRTVSLETSVNYNIKTGKPYTSVKEFLLQASTEKDIISMQIDGLEAIKVIHANSAIWLFTFTRDKSHIYSIYYHSNFWESDKKVFDEIVSSMKINNESVDLTRDWQVYTNSDAKVAFKYPPEFKVKQASGNVQVGEYLTMSFNDYRMVHNSYPLCSNLSESDRLDKACVTETTETFLGGKKARLFWYSHGVDSERVIIQSPDPKLELDMFVAGGGLREDFNRILSTFRYLE